MIPVGGWAIVAGCLMVNGPDCSGYLATGLVWGTQERCVDELRRANIPGGQCMQIVGINEPQGDVDATGIDKIIQALDEEVRSGGI